MQVTDPGWRKQSALNAFFNELGYEIDENNIRPKNQKQPLNMGYRQETKVGNIFLCSTHYLLQFKNSESDTPHPINEETIRKSSYQRDQGKPEK